jgi:hypothetical protein
MKIANQTLQQLQDASGLEEKRKILQQLQAAANPKTQQASASSAVLSATASGDAGISGSAQASVGAPTDEFVQAQTAYREALKLVWNQLPEEDRARILQEQKEWGIQDISYGGDEFGDNYLGNYGRPGSYGWSGY